MMELYEPWLSLGAAQVDLMGNPEREAHLR